MCDKPYYIIHKFADFDSDTKHMTRNQRGIYLDLRTLYFTTAHANNGRIDDDFELLCFRLSCHSEADKMDLRLVLADKFKKIGKVYRHADWDKQIKGIMCEIRKNGRNTGNVDGNTQGNTGNTQGNTPLTPYERKVKSEAKREKILAELASIGVVPSDDAKMKELEALYKAHFGYKFSNGGNTGNITGNTQGNTDNAQKAPNNILTNNYKPITNNINNTHTQTSEEKNSPVENQPQSEKTKAEIIREQRADELENWQPPTLEEISSQLFRIGFEINITQAQYESHIQDFKAYYIEQALYGKPLNTEALRKSKLRAWLQNAMQKQKTNHNSNSTGVKNATHQQNRTKRTTRPEYTDKLEQQRQTYFTQSTVGERTMRDVYPVENVVSQQNECR